MRTYSTVKKLEWNRVRKIENVQMISKEELFNY